VVDLDAGCCGLAGSFGYEKEHYDVSCLFGEQRLFPALRRAPPQTPSWSPRVSPAGRRSPTGSGGRLFIPQPCCARYCRVSIPAHKTRTEFPRYAWRTIDASRCCTSGLVASVRLNGPSRGCDDCSHSFASPGRPQPWGR
jgi:hypothetical protein